MSNMSNIGKHVVEFYKANKFLGSKVMDGDIPQEQVGYYGKTLMTAGQVALKRVYKATDAQPIEVVKYNLQGRVETAK